MKHTLNLQVRVIWGDPSLEEISDLVHLASEEIKKQSPDRKGKKHITNRHETLVVSWEFTDD